MNPTNELNDALWTWPAPSPHARQRAIAALAELAQERDQLVAQIKRSQESELAKELDSAVKPPKQ